MASNEEINSSSAGSDVSTSGITDAEAEVYDRQLRVWGMKAQLKLRKSHVLVIGVDGLCTELCKTLCLAGVNSISIWDDRAIDREALSANFILNLSHLGKNVCIRLGFHSF